MQGFLLIDKPKFWTSFDVVKHIRYIVANAKGLPQRKIKVGHSGTLDPFATGLLIIMIGKQFTSQAETLLKQDKSYEVDMILDSESTTGDSEGLIKTHQRTQVRPVLEDIQKVIKGFEGPSMQTPPIYSAIKINGVRAYSLARNNQPIQMEPRKITIHSIHLEDYIYPLVRFKCDVSSGTYIRSLVEDIGKGLGTSAYTKELRRTRIGLCSIDQAIDLSDLTEHNIADYLILPPQFPERKLVG